MKILLHKFDFWRISFTILSSIFVAFIVVSSIEGCCNFKWLESDTSWFTLVYLSIPYFVVQILIYRLLKINVFILTKLFSLLLYLFL